MRASRCLGHRRRRGLLPDRKSAQCRRRSAELFPIGYQGTGTSAYRAYSRAHEISAQGKTAIAGSSDPVFRGDAARWNPAELLIAALSRAHEISAQGKTAIAGSSDPVFRGDAARWNPAELLIAALSACHQLWYLHLCADA